MATCSIAKVWTVKIQCSSVVIAIKQVIFKKHVLKQESKRKREKVLHSILFFPREKVVNIFIYIQQMAQKSINTYIPNLKDGRYNQHKSP